MDRGLDADFALEAIVLAAGSGVRFGGGKLLAPFQGRPLLAGALAVAGTPPVRAVTLVTGADAPAVAAAALALDPRLRIIHAVDHAEGMGASLRAGVAALPADTRAVAVFLGDMPRVPPGVLKPLAEAIWRGAPAAAPVWRSRRGHPVIFGKALFPALLRATGDAGARDILKDLGGGLALIDAPDDGVLFDVDVPADLE